MPPPKTHTKKRKEETCMEDVAQLAEHMYKAVASVLSSVNTRYDDAHL